MSKKNDSNFAGYAAIIQICSIFNYLVFGICLVLFYYGIPTISFKFINQGLVVMSAIVAVSSTINATLYFRQNNLKSTLVYLANIVIYIYSFMFYLHYLLPLS